MNFLERMRAGVTRMQLWPHLVRFLVCAGEKMLNSPPQGMLNSLHTCTTHVSAAAHGLTKGNHSMQA